VEDTGGAQTPLFTSPCGGFVANLSWRPGEGWRVWANSWAEGHEPDQRLADLYTYLTADEALDVLQASVFSRCEWLRR